MVSLFATQLMDTKRLQSTKGLPARLAIIKVHVANIIILTIKLKGVVATFIGTV